MLKTMFEKLESLWFVALILLFATGAFRILHQRGHELVSGVPDALVDVIGIVSLLAFAVLVLALLAPPVRTIYRRFAKGSVD